MVHVNPQLGVRGPIFSGADLQEVVLQEGLLAKDVGMLEMQLFRGFGCSFFFYFFGLCLRSEGLGGDVVGEELGVN